MVLSKSFGTQDNGIIGSFANVFPPCIFCTLHQTTGDVSTTLKALSPNDDQASFSSNLSLALYALSSFVASKKKVTCSTHVIYYLILHHLDNNVCQSTSEAIANILRPFTCETAHPSPLPGTPIQLDHWIITILFPQNDCGHFAHASFFPSNMWGRRPRWGCGLISLDGGTIRWTRIEFWNRCWGAF